jgi:hypothetical protein
VLHLSAWLVNTAGCVPATLLLLLLLLCSR